MEFGSKYAEKKRKCQNKLKQKIKDNNWLQAPWKSSDIL